MTKVSLSLDSDLVEQARRIAGKRALSALVNDALRVRLQHARLRTLLGEMDQEFGPVPASEVKRARETWRDPDEKAPRRRKRPPRA